LIHSATKLAAINAYETLGKELFGVRLDTPSSRRGDMRKLVQEVRWELWIRGAKDVKIIVSGGIGEKDVLELRDYVDGFGIGAGIAAAPVVDFCDKIVEKENNEGERVFLAKRGDLAGRKNVFRNYKTFEDIVTIKEAPPSSECEPVLKPPDQEWQNSERFHEFGGNKKKDW
jgi:nicotinate phosphoribosyltransferase